MANYKRMADDNSIEAIEKALIANRGNITATARAFKVNRGLIYKRINENPHLKEVLDEQREIALDLAEDVLRQKWEDERDTTSLIFFLKTQGYKRGYGNRTQIVGDENNGPVQLKVVYENE